VLAILVAATVLAFFAILAVWANRQALNTDNWTETSSRLLEDDDIRQQVAVFLIDQLYANVDVENEIRSALPPRAQPLAGPIAGGVRNFAERAANELLSRPRPQKLWEEANRRAHRRLLQIVEGGGDVVGTEGGQVTLDLNALLGQTQQRVGAGGRLQEKLPPEAGQLVILRSDQLEFAQDLVNLIKDLAVVLVVLALGLFALAVALATGWRREALRATGIAFVAAGVAVLVARAIGGNVVTDSLTTTESVRPAAESAWTIGTSLLRDAAVAMISYGVVIVVAAWVAGPTRAATATRGALAPYAREPAIAYGATAIVLGLVLLWAPTPAWRQALPVLLMIGLVLLGVEALRRQTAREFPEASREEAASRRRERLASLAESVRGRRAGGGPGESEQDRITELERLARLKESGAIDAAEYQREKQRLLG
jgi:putative oligomerization/nucleic acid binding protein